MFWARAFSPERFRPSILARAVLYCAHCTLYSLRSAHFLHATTDTLPPSFEHHSNILGTSSTTVMDFCPGNAATAAEWEAALAPRADGTVGRMDEPLHTHRMQQRAEVSASAAGAAAAAAPAPPLPLGQRQRCYRSRCCLRCTACRSRGCEYPRRQQ